MVGESIFTDKISIGKIVKTIAGLTVTFWLLFDFLVDKDSFSGLGRKCS